MALTKSVLLVIILFLTYTGSKFTFDKITESIKTTLISKSSKNNLLPESFLINCIDKWNMTQPKVFISKEIRRHFLLKHLSKKRLQALVRNHISSKELQEVIFDDGSTHIIVVGEEKYILETFKKIAEMYVLHMQGLLLLICLDCEDANFFIEGEDSMATILFCNQILNNKEIKYNIRKLYYNYNARGFTMNLIGSWNGLRGFSFDENEYPLQDQNDFFDLQGKMLNVLVVVKTVLYLRNLTRSGNNSSVGGMLGDLLKVSSQKMNFTYNLTFTDTMYGDYDSQSSQGVILEFIKTNSDLSLGIFSQTVRRTSLVHFTVPFAKDAMTFMMKAPSKINAGTWMLCLKSFNASFWLAILLLTMLMGLTLGTVIRRSSPKNDMEVECSPILLSIISLQGNDYVAKTQSSRIVIITSYLFFWMIFAIYNGVLVSFLTLDNAPRLTTLDDIIKSDYNLYAAQIGFVLDLLKFTKNDQLKKLSTRVQPTASLEDGAEALCTIPKYSHAFDTVMINYLLNDYPECEVYALKEILYEDYYHLLTQKSGVLNKRLSKLFTKLKEVGIMKRMEYKNDVMMYFRYRRKEYEQWVSIHLHHVFVPLGIIAAGVILSAIALLIEIINHHWHKMRMTLS